MKNPVKYQDAQAEIQEAFFEQIGYAFYMGEST